MIRKMRKAMKKMMKKMMTERLQHPVLVAANDSQCVAVSVVVSLRVTFLLPSDHHACHSA